MRTSIAVQQAITATKLQRKRAQAGPQAYFDTIDKLTKRLDNLQMFQVSVSDRMLYAQKAFKASNVPPNVICDINCKWKTYKVEHHIGNTAHGWTSFKKYYTAELLKVYDNHKEEPSHALVTKERLNVIKPNLNILEVNQLNLGRAMSVTDRITLPTEIETNTTLTERDSDSTITALRAKNEQLKEENKSKTSKKDTVLQGPYKRPWKWKKAKGYCSTHGVCTHTSNKCCKPDPDCPHCNNATLANRTSTDSDKNLGKTGWWVGPDFELYKEKTDYKNDCVGESQSL